MRVALPAQPDGRVFSFQHGTARALNLNRLERRDALRRAEVESERLTPGGRNMTAILVALAFIGFILLDLVVQKVEARRANKNP